MQKLVTVPVMACIYPFAKPARDALRAFYAVLAEVDPAAPRPTHRQLFRHLLGFAWSLADKTQVFSLVRNDDITRRSFHLQVVSRVGRTIGMALGLNLDLIEAIAVGHDLGHTPFGHEGEHLLSGIYHSRTGRYFNHNVHSVRLLRTMANTNLCLQTYSGILSHCGEKAFLEYRPAPCDSFEQLDRIMDECYLDQSNIADLRPSTLEGCVVRISDIIAYAGKDRHALCGMSQLSPPHLGVLLCPSRLV